MSKSAALSRRLATRIGAVDFKNPVFTASGTFGSGREFEDFLDLKKVGAVVMKSVTLEPRQGCPPPRVGETPAGMLNAIGLQNQGIDHFLAELLPYTRARADRVVVNIAGKTEDEYVALAERLNGCGAEALEVNVSCPNVTAGGIEFGVRAETLERLTGRLRRATALPLWVKLSPNVTDIRDLARAAEAGGADALVVANTAVGMAIDIEQRRPLLSNVTGGLSGPAIHPLALRLVWQTAGAVRIPVIGCGGVAGLREVVGFLLAGASAVEVGTMNFVEPALCNRLVDELATWLEDHETTVADLIGALETDAPGWDESGK